MQLTGTYLVLLTVIEEYNYFVVWVFLCVCLLVVVFFFLNKPVMMIGSLVKQGKYVGGRLLHTENKVSTNFSTSVLESLTFGRVKKVDVVYHSILYWYS